jgi:hypothetical protein
VLYHRDSDPRHPRGRGNRRGWRSAVARP